MGNLFAAICNFLGSFGAAAGTNACVVWVLDEPEMPRSLIEK